MNKYKFLIKFWLFKLFYLYLKILDIPISNLYFLSQYLEIDH